MRWFKHDTSDRNRVEAKLIKAKFGAEGYGIYLALLEVIGEAISEHNYKEWGHVDKMHDTETLAAECCVSVEKLKEFLKFCDERGIFEKRDGRLYSGLIKLRLDEYAEKVKKKKTRSGVNRDKIGTKSGQDHDTVGNKEEEKREEENKEEKKKGERGATPAQRMRDFIESEKLQLKAVGALTEKGVNPEVAAREVKKFISYWTEPSKSGHKQRWELQEAFDVGRRLGTWFSKIGGPSGSLAPKVAKV